MINLNIWQFNTNLKNMYWFINMLFKANCFINVEMPHVDFDLYQLLDYFHVVVKNVAHI